MAAGVRILHKRKPSAFTSTQLLAGEIGVNTGVPRLEWSSNGTDINVVSPAASGWTTLSKPSTQVRTNSAVLIDDVNLSFNMLASTNYRIRGTIFFDTTAAGDFKYTFLGPASPIAFRGSRIHIAATGTPAMQAIDIAYPSAAGIALTGTGTAGGYIGFEFVVLNGLNAGAFRFAFAQNSQTNDAGAQALAGSYMEYAVA